MLKKRVQQVQAREEPSQGQRDGEGAVELPMHSVICSEGW